MLLELRIDIRSCIKSRWSCIESLYFMVIVLLVTYLHLYYLRVDVVCLQWIRLGIKDMLRLIIYKFVLIYLYLLDLRSDSDR